MKRYRGSSVRGRPSVQPHVRWQSQQTMVVRLNPRSCTHSDSACWSVESSSNTVCFCSRPIQPNSQSANQLLRNALPAELLQAISGFRALDYDIWVRFLEEPGSELLTQWQNVESDW